MRGVCSPKTDGPSKQLDLLTYPRSYGNGMSTLRGVDELSEYLTRLRPNHLGLSMSKFSHKNCFQENYVLINLSVSNFPTTDEIIILNSII